MRTPLIHGLGSRVMGLSRIMSTEGEKAVTWCISKQLPLGYREVFPNGIDGVNMVDAPVGKLIAYLWKKPFDESKRPDALRRIFAAMELPPVPKCELGILFRGHRPDGLKLPEFAPEILSAMLETSGPIATLCDSQRAAIREIIGPRMIPQESAEMKHDMDRAELDIRTFAFEWWRLLNCRRIITNCPKSSLVWPKPFLD